MRYGYGRVSSKGQQKYGMSLEDQEQTLLKAGAEKIYLDTFTGTKIDRPKFTEVLNLLQDGDELIVCKLDRFARNTPEGVSLMRELVDRGVKVNILNMGVADNTPMGKVMVSVMMAFAEYERDMIVERTQTGKNYKREHVPGWREGRRKLEIDKMSFEKIAKKQKEGLLSIEDCCKELGICRTKFYELKKELGHTSVCA